MKNSESTTDIHYTSPPLKIQNPTEFSQTKFKFIADSNIEVSNKKLDNVSLNDNKIDTCENNRPLNIGKTNDMDSMYIQTKGIFPKYISPLDNIERLV